MRRDKSVNDVQSYAFFCKTETIKRTIKGYRKEDKGN